MTNEERFIEAKVLLVSAESEIACNNYDVALDTLARAAAHTHDLFFAVQKLCPKSKEKPNEPKKTG